MEFAIIAAGEGSRLVSEGVSVPKPLVDIDGRPMIGRLLDIMGDSGAGSVTVVVNEQMSEVTDWLRTRDREPEVVVRVKTTPDSMHTFAEATAGFDGKFAVTTVDTIFSPTLFRECVEAFEADTETDGYMCVTDFIDDEKPLYVAVDSDMNITAFHDSREESDTPSVSAGIYMLTPRALATLRRCLAEGVTRMRNFQRELIADGLRLKARPLGKVIDVDHISDIATARQMVGEFENQSIQHIKNGRK